jgi:3',5'-cyclic AMP phosphodiesterase CpdA
MSQGAVATLGRESLLLHLTDLHLGRGPDAALRSDPGHILPADPDQRLRFVTDSLERLAAKLARPLDCIVLSGDLVDRAAHNEFDRIPDLLEALGRKAPAPERVVVVPGNHDMAWDPPPPDRSRYDAWVEKLVRRGYTSPPLDGWTDDELEDAGGTDKFIVEGDDFVVIPINSSHFCWTLGSLNSQEALWTDVIDCVRHATPGGSPTALAATSAARVEQVERAITELRRHDMARISQDQLRRVRAAVAGRGREKVVIAVLHHHLTPITAREELKSFESLTNLGEVKRTLADLNVDVVLHGHKHESAIFWDSLPYGDPQATPHRGNRPVLIVAAPGELSHGGLLGRLLEIEGTPKARWVRVRDVVGGQTGNALPGGSVKTFDLWRAAESVEEPGPVTVTITGPDPHVVYERLMAYVEACIARGAAPPRHVVCQFDDAELALTLPPTYPEVPEPDRQAWFERLVAWWQRPDGRSLGGDVFNHGDRLRTRWDNQLDRAVEALRQHPRSTRAVLELLDPALETSDATRRYPSLVIVQFGQTEGQRRSLEVFGYWRKQELRWGWPINIAELRTLQRDVLTRIDDRGLVAGRITTYAFHAHVGATIPSAYLPEIDRAVDEDPGLLVSLVYAVMHPEFVDPARALAKWRELLLDLVSSQPLPAQSRPRLGLSELIIHLDAMTETSQHEATEARQVLRALERVDNAHANDDDAALRREVAELEIAVTEALGTRRAGDSHGA